MTIAVMDYVAQALWVLSAKFKQQRDWPTPEN